VVEAEADFASATMDCQYVASGFNRGRFEPAASIGAAVETAFTLMLQSEYPTALRPSPPNTFDSLREHSGHISRPASRSARSLSLPSPDPGFLPGLGRAAISDRTNVKSGLERAAYFPIADFGRSRRDVRFVPEVASAGANRRD
jgi:hypothetical protein